MGSKLYSTRSCSDEWLGRRLAALFALIALPTSVVLAVLTPLNGAPDENRHAIRAGAVAEGHFTSRRGFVTIPGQGEVGWDGVDVDPAVWEVMKVVPSGAVTVDRAMLDRQRTIAWAGAAVLTPCAFTASYLPAFYVPSAVGIAAARRLGYGPYKALIAGRIANALTFAVLGAAALALSRRAHCLFFCALSFPMTISLAGSFNQDALLIASSALAAALVTRSEAAPPGAQGALRAVATLLLAAVCGAKLAYAPLAALLLLPLASPRSLRARDWLERVAALAVVVFVVVGWWSLTGSEAVSIKIPHPPYEAGPHWPGTRPATFASTDPQAQGTVLRARPLLAVTLTWSSIVQNHAMLRWQMIGILGWLHVLLAPFLYTLWNVALAASAAGDAIGGSDADHGPGILDACVLIGAAVSALIAVHVACYVIWTDVGLDRIDGPQGRYFLPLLPVVACALPRLRFAGGAVLRGVLAAAPVASAAAGMASLPLTILFAFYV